MAQEQHQDSSSGRTLMKAIRSVVRPFGMFVLWIMFYTIVTPLAVTMRLFGKDILRLNRDARAASYWIVREQPGPRPESMTRQT
jgi:hypothetical protein